jgi:alkanesulfonate monooxygenase SsuD/methylene tetrahydromethanopterin reductase-like flavin-dependent oxidoreductase (luciferase family)
MTLVRNATIYVDRDHESAVNAARRVFESGAAGPAPSLEAYLHNAIVGTPQECLAGIQELESWGINYLRLSFPSLEHQTQFAQTLLPVVQKSA